MRIVTLRNTAVPGVVPDSSTVVAGELILNIADGRLYFKNLLGDMDFISGKLDSLRVQRWNNRSGDVVPEAGDYTAAGITFVPQLGLLADNLQEAVEFLFDEKASAVHVHDWASITNKPPTTYSWQSIQNKPQFSPLATLQLPGDERLALRGDGTWGILRGLVEWSDIKGKPNVFPTAPVRRQQVFWSQVEQKPSVFPTSWSLVQSKPLFGDFTELLFSNQADQLLNGLGQWVSLDTIVAQQSQITWGQISDKPTTFATNWSAVQNKPQFGSVSSVSLSNNSAQVLKGDGTWGEILVSGNVDWSNILSKPLQFPSTWGIVTDKPLFGTVSLVNLSNNQNQVLRGDGTWGTPTQATVTSVAWADVSGKPSFGTVALVNLNASGGQYLNGQGAFAQVAWSQISGRPVLGSLSAISAPGNAALFLNGQGAFTEPIVTWSDVTNKPSFGSLSASNFNNDGSSVLSGTGSWVSQSALAVGWGSVQNKPGWLSGNGDATQYLRGNLTYGSLQWADIQGVSISYSSIQGRPTLGNLSAIQTNNLATHYLNGQGQWVLIDFLDSDSVLGGGTY